MTVHRQWQRMHMAQGEKSWIERLNNSCWTLSTARKT